jgi:hypothetical protein
LRDTQGAYDTVTTHRAALMCLLGEVPKHDYADLRDTSITGSIKRESPVHAGTCRMHAHRLNHTDHTVLCTCVQRTNITTSDAAKVGPARHACKLDRNESVLWKWVHWQLTTNSSRYDAAAQEGSGQHACRLKHACCNQGEQISRGDKSAAYQQQRSLSCCGGGTRPACTSCPPALHPSQPSPQGASFHPLPGFSDS